ncbi:radical SAM/SPASM domain-containing protein [Sporolactobacillus terrae]|uniref:radical SAM/SPASM domain-containing protein n=1 Tax=Sporolactobacillus terrae TaxID=269673 RepID=UPI0013E344B7|nr:radical SAM protein [Sporolactobacillus terrae]UAK17202.1 radical SAM protein [Sporolactobacillus terrae]
MLFQLKNDVIVRREFWGGLIIVINKGEFEINDFTTDLLLLFELTNDISQQAVILSALYQQDIAQDIITDAISELDNFLRPAKHKYHCLTDLTINKFKKEKEEVKKIDFLSAPVNVSLYPGMVCNLKCKFCFVSQEKWDDKKVVYPMNQWIPVLNEIKKLKIPYLTILGGEPLLYPDIWNMLDYLDAIGQKTHITTNGSILSTSIIDHLKKYHNLTLKVSLQSLDDRHKELTYGSWEKTVNFVKNCREVGIDCGIHTLALPKTIDGIYQLVDFAVKEGLYEFSMGAFANINQVEIKGFSLKENREISSKVKKYIKEKYNDAINYRLEGCQIWTGDQQLQKSNIPKSPYEILKSGCSAAQTRLEIMNDGTMLGCALFDKNKFSAGNVFESSIKNIWLNSSVFKILRSGKTKDIFCNSCKFEYFCHGGCPALNYVTTGDMWSGDTRCQIRDNLIKHGKEDVTIV